ncbi:hypothetical protein SK3146_04967 [Paenibacillus konkukensis]|uniref:Uncharacterized protein n=1 Tax=Paenibacillus konkukensis TaxID=2020716 RepID=A0ABY4RVU4_9BACL|nr:hypothetical protein [Paenibacillus konkukensis]UQZ85678.1 hypothetical protein SK3146_04967 [Paenibacillus konkukensis]
MITKWKRILVVFALLVSLLIPPMPPLATAQEGAPAPADYYVTETVKASVKNILNEQAPEGVRIAAVVRLYNEGSRLTRVPDYEVRAKTDGGIEYTLRPSAANAIAIQPKETVELTYMIVVDREDAFSVSQISWVDVDEFVSPRKETTMLSIPVSSIEWRGDLGAFSDPSVNKQWGEAFTIAELSPVIEYKPISLIEQNTPQGPKSILTLLAENKGDKKKTIPDFLINGKAEQKVFTGKRLEQDAVALEPNEQKYIHYAIPAGKKEEMKSLTVLTPESFAVDDKTKIDYSIGRFSIALPDGNAAAASVEQSEPYEMNQWIRFDPLNRVIQPEIGVALVDLHIHDSVGGGFKAAVAKFKLQNRSDRPMPVPKFQAQLVSAAGNQYTGNRQTTVVETLAPNISYVIYYTFVLPTTEKGERLTMEILDGDSVAPYNIPIARLKTKAQSDQSDGDIQFYPFTVKFNSWKEEVFYGSAKSSLPYSYKLTLDLDVKLQDQSVVDQSFPKLKVELVDASGNVIGSKALPFTGDNRVASGIQTFSMDSTLFEFSNTLRVYETVDTPFGEADRLVATLQ